MLLHLIGAILQEQDDEQAVGCAISVGSNAQPAQSPAGGPDTARARSLREDRAEPHIGFSATVTATCHPASPPLKV
jgi:hypothetical protein